jgi:hypothetical protein
MLANTIEAGITIATVAVSWMLHLQEVRSLHGLASAVLGKVQDAAAASADNGVTQQLE